MINESTTRDMKPGRRDHHHAPGTLVCTRECVTPGVGQGSWLPGDKVNNPADVRTLSASPYFKSSSEVK